MHTIEEAYRFTSELYWIAYLLTGNEELSSRVTINALDSENGLECMSTPQLPPLLRTTVINNALRETQAETSLSAHKFASQYSEYSDTDFIAIPAWWVDASISNVQIENALLAIELFPRCALLLTFFEGLSQEEAGTLLHSGCDLIRAGRLWGLTELTRNLVPMTAASYAVRGIEYDLQPVN